MRRRGWAGGRAAGRAELEARVSLHVSTKTTRKVHYGVACASRCPTSHNDTVTLPKEGGGEKNEERMGMSAGSVWDPCGMRATSKKRGEKSKHAVSTTIILVQNMQATASS